MPAPLLRGAVAPVASLLAVSACTLGGSVTPGFRSPSILPAASGSPAPALAPNQFVNPVLGRDFPDPGALKVGSTWYAYATTGNGDNLQAARSTDLVHWEYLDEVLPKLATWSTGDTWAPEVRRTSAGYVMYYTTRDPNLIRPDGTGSQCVSVAVASSPAGPFSDRSSGPLVCQPKLGGSIDPFPFTDADGTRYLIWKSDGNCCQMPTRIWGQRLSADGLSLVPGTPTDLGETNDQAWEGSVVEAPTLLLHDGTYFLFYSAGNYADGTYAVGYATAPRVLGPYRDAVGNPILKTRDAAGAQGPGGQTIVTAPDGSLWVLYHAWDPNFLERSMWLDRLRFVAGRPVIDGPTDRPQAKP
ncbi:MAG: glycoside hydrolase [Chloroflexi bacterium]|nr:MAG: glycoside hydrolase [Chloroflexota bacterium]